MNSSMINAMVTMNGLQQKLDLLSDNIANSNTVGYKRKEASFADLLQTMYSQPDDFEQPGRMTSLGFNQGWGARLSSVETNFQQGVLKETGIKTDFAINGDAMFEVSVNDGADTAYTRSGAFQLTPSASGDTILATEQGYPVIGQVYDKTLGQYVDTTITVPKNYTITVASDGTIKAASPDGDTLVDLPRLKLAQATRPSALTATEDNLFMLQPGLNADEVMQQVQPDDENGIVVQQGYLEQSNVDLTNEITELISVQRAYQLAARALTSSDTMMGLANNMRA